MSTTSVGVLLPLYQVVFHDSLVSTDRWEMSLVKFSNLIQVRTLLQLLYNVPSMWSLDRQAIRENEGRIRSLDRMNGTEVV